MTITADIFVLLLLVVVVVVVEIGSIASVIVIHNTANISTY